MDSYIAGFKNRIRNKDINIAVIGLGYVGLPLAVEFAKKGFSVIGVELDKDRVSKIRQMRSYILDVPTSELKKVIKNGKFCVSEDFKSLQHADAILICVPTPLKRKYNPDISFIKNAVKAVSRNVGRRSVIILESTTYPGTTEEVILPILESSGLVHGKDFYLCFSPERIDPGNELFPLNRIPKIVGGISVEAAELGRAVYEIIVSKAVKVSSTRVAETAKLLENTFRIVNIGMIDELAMMAHKMKIDIWEVIEAAKTKPFGFMPFYPGPGVGGHCIPKDPLYLYWKAKKFGFRSRFIKLASDLISHMPYYVVSRLNEALAKEGKSLEESRILIVGATYKKDIKDLRKSPALDIIEILLKKGSCVSYYDPLIPYLKFNECIDLKSIKISSSALSGYDCILIATDHSNINYGFILKHARLIFDTRNKYKGIKNNKVIRL